MQSCIRLFMFSSREGWFCNALMNSCVHSFVHACRHRYRLGTVAVSVARSALLTPCLRSSSLTHSRMPACQTTHGTSTCGSTKWLIAVVLTHLNMHMHMRARTLTHTHAHNPLSSFLLLCVSVCSVCYEVLAFRDSGPAGHHQENYYGGSISAGVGGTGISNTDGRVGKPAAYSSGANLEWLDDD
jgi:hypothetical protein